MHLKQNRTIKQMTGHYRKKQYTTKHEHFTDGTIEKERETMPKEININRINRQKVVIKIVGDTDLVLNKMNDVTIRQLSDARKDKAKNMEKPNIWEQIITSMHWYNGKPSDFTEEGLMKALKDNRPCITAFGLKKSFGDAVVRNEIDKYKTKFDAGVNVLGKGGLVPITFTEYSIDEKLMSPKKGSPVLVNLNRFTGWSADIEVEYVENAYSLEQIINIINLAGFGLGIGSGRSSGFGRYHVDGLEVRECQQKSKV